MQRKDALRGEKPRTSKLKGDLFFSWLKVLGLTDQGNHKDEQVACKQEGYTIHLAMNEHRPALGRHSEMFTALADKFLMPSFQS